ncbi:hypothetical protein [Sphaerisporangium rhizosphaerae]|uniref:Uncharacterized protein n=1 Tax=Sphaerisporangium rhizosphaerae TaxID=2269375 RepID=A0ABW2PE31_9ACTN
MGELGEMPADGDVRGRAPVLLGLVSVHRRTGNPRIDIAVPTMHRRTDRSPEITAITWIDWITQITEASPR